MWKCNSNEKRHFNLILNDIWHSNDLHYLRIYKMKEFKIAKEYIIEDNHVLCIKEADSYAV